MAWIYVNSEPGLWTVGTYDGGKWSSDEDFGNRQDARDRCHYLNGGNGKQSERIVTDGETKAKQEAARLRLELKEANESIDTLRESLKLFADDAAKYRIEVEALEGWKKSALMSFAKWSTVHELVLKNMSPADVGKNVQDTIIHYLKKDSHFKD